MSKQEGESRVKEIERAIDDLSGDKAREMLQTLYASSDKVTQIYISEKVMED